MNKKPIDKTIPKFWRHKNRRLSAEPLFSLIDGLELTNTQIGEALNIHRTTINKWREKGIPIYQADKVACWSAYTLPTYGSVLSEGLKAGCYCADIALPHIAWVWD